MSRQALNSSFAVSTLFMPAKNRWVLYLLVLAFGILGIWLNGWFADSVDEVSSLRLISGLLVVCGASVGFALLLREDLRQTNPGRMAAWAMVRQRGKRTYIRSAISRGFWLSAPVFIFQIAIDYWKTGSFRSALDSSWVYVALFLVIIFASYYAAIRMWDAKERDYEVSANRQNVSAHCADSTD